MNYTDQQKQTKDFFERYSQQWSLNAKNNYEDFVNVIQIRNQYVEQMCEKFLSKDDKILDVGCGTGDLVISLVKTGYDAIGIDFASNMIEEARSDAKNAKISQDRFIKSSIFDFNSDRNFHLISANGLIEYVSECEFLEFLKKAYNLLNKNGILVFESRNRLFNCFSFNKYTLAEKQLGELENLLEECILFNEIKDKKALLESNFTPRISKNLQHHEQTTSKHANIEVDTRYQYTPFQIINTLRDNNFEVLDIFPAHIHAISPSAKDKHPEIHTKLSYYLLNQVDIHLPLIPQTSSFMITSRKK